MLKLKRKLLTGILAASIALSAGSGLVWSESDGAVADDTAVSEITSDSTDEAADGEETDGEETDGEAADGEETDGEAADGEETDGEAADGEETDGEAADGEETDGEAADGEETDGEAADGEETDGEEEISPVTEEEALANMVLYAENDNLALYVNEETYVFAVQNKKNDYYWWSAPYDYDSDPLAAMSHKNKLLSHIYFDAGKAAESVNSYSDSIQNGTSSVDKIENGALFGYSFIKTEMEINMYVTLNEDSFDVEIPVDQIVEYASDPATAEVVYQLLNLDLLNGMGAAGTSDEGYMLVPDGSGAVINFNNGKDLSTGTTVYKASVYGSDLAISRETAAAKTEQVYLPVIGMVKEGDNGDNALIGVVTEGDAFASVNANVSGQATTSYNNIWFSFTLRAEDTYTIGTKEPLTVFEANGIKADSYKVRYYVMDGDELTLADLAETYRNYLVEEKGLTQQTNSYSNTLYLTLDGGTVKTQSVLGFPIDLQTTGTTYKQALEIIKQLEAQGVEDITVVYNDYSDSGIGGQITSSVDYSGNLGGKNDFSELYKYVDSKGDALFPSVEFMQYSDSGKGYSFTLNASKRLTNAYATQYRFMCNYGVPLEDAKVGTILSPYYFPDLFRKLVESYTAEGIDTISLSSATSVLYSDFSRTNFDDTPYFTREDAINILIDGYKKLNDAGITILAQQCNAYALPYVSAITEVPLYSSNFDLFDYDVPFYQMVIHGYIPYSSKPVNASSNADELLMLSLLTDSDIHYEMMYNDPNEFTDCTYSELFYTHYAGWIDDVSAEYKLMKEITPDIADQTITKYEVRDKDTYRITYSDGTTIEANVDALTLKVNGKTVSLADYGLKGESN